MSEQPWIRSLKESAAAGGANFVVANGRSGPLVTVLADPFGAGAATAYEVAFDHRAGSTCAGFVSDISRAEDISPGSSSPAEGWVSWQRAPQLIVAWQHPEREEVRASTLSVEELPEGDELSDGDWAAIARAITLDVMSDAPPARWKYLGQVEVDSGTLLVADPAYVLPHAELGKPGVDYADLVLDRSKGSAAERLPIVLVNNFGGDGSFPVYGDEEDGELYRLSIAFVEPEEDE